MISALDLCKGCMTNLSTRWLGEPQRPIIHQRVLNVEIIRVVEDGNLFVALVLFLHTSSIWGSTLVANLTIHAVGAVRWGNRDSLEIDW